jgi:hypothetical protein
VIDYEGCDGDTKEREGLIRLDEIPLKGKEPEVLCTIGEYRWGGIDWGDLLDPVELAKPHEVIVMPVGPDHGIDVGRTAPEELLAQIGRCVNKDVFSLVLDEKRGPEA